MTWVFSLLFALILIKQKADLSITLCTPSFKPVVRDLGAKYNSFNVKYTIINYLHSLVDWISQIIKSSTLWQQGVFPSTLQYNHLNFMQLSHEVVL